MNLLKSLVFIIFNFFFLTSYALSQNVIYYVDLDKLVKDSKTGKILIIELEEIKKKNDKNLQLKKDEIIKFETDLRKKKNILSDDELKKEIRKLEESYANYKKSEQLVKQKFIGKKNENLSNFFSKINPLIENYMKKNSIDILMDKKNIFIGLSKYDITEDILEIINKSL